MFHMFTAQKRRRGHRRMYSHSRRAFTARTEQLEERCYFSAGSQETGIAMVAVAKSAPDALLGSQDIRALNQKFDESISWIDSHTLVKDYYVFDIDHPLHQVVLELQDVRHSGFTNLPVGAHYAGKGQIRGLNVVVAETLSHVYLSSTSDFTDAVAVCVGEEALPERMWFPTKITNETVKFQYGFLDLNTRLSDTLVDMYQMTGHEPYLERAQRLLTKLSSFIASDGKFYRRFEDVDIPNDYNGTSQALILQSLDKYLSVAGPEPHLHGQLIRMALGYEHTTEGVFNRSNTSLVGNLIRDRVLQEHTVNYHKVDYVLGRLYDEIEANDGKIPKVIDPDIPTYPHFQPSYYPFDTYLVALLTKYLPFEIHYDTVFEKAFSTAQKVNAPLSMGHNAGSLRYMRESYGRVDTAFAAEVLRYVVNTDIERLPRIYEVLNVMMSATHLIKYEAAAYDLDRNGRLDSDDVDWLFGAMEMDPVAMPIGSRFDIDGSGTVDKGDLDAWLTGAAPLRGQDAPFRGGDIDLDGKIGLDDFFAFNVAFYEAERDDRHGAGWGDGDFDGNGKTDLNDLMTLTTNWSKN